MSDKKIVMNLEAIMGDRFGKYSKYIIQERALPDVRDGLKPVQRRILYSMNKEGNTANKPYRKSAKTVGNVIIIVMVIRQFMMQWFVFRKNGKSEHH